MEVRNILVGVIFVVVLYVVYIFAFKRKHSSLVTTQKVDSSITVDVPGTNSSNAYSLWLYVSEWDVDGKKHVMTRYSKCSSDKDIKCFSPTVYLGQSSNTLYIDYLLDDTMLDSISISDFPIQSWTNLIISTNTKTIDVYINGKLVRSHILRVPPHNPHGKLYLGRLNNVSINYPKDNDITDKKTKSINSYTGYISTVKYFDEPVTPSDAWSIYNEGYDDAGLNPNILGKYKVKMSILDNNREVNSLEI